MYVLATPMCVWRRHAAHHRCCKGVKVVGRRASPRRRKNYDIYNYTSTVNIRKHRFFFFNSLHIAALEVFLCEIVGEYSILVY